MKFTLTKQKNSFTLPVPSLPTNMESVTIAAFDDICGNFIQIAQQ